MGLGLLLTGLALQLTIGPIRWEWLAYPVNVLVLLVYLVLILLAFWARGRVRVLRFQASYQAAVPALVYAVSLTALMGLLRQTPGTDTGLLGSLSNMLTFWPFVLVYGWISFIVALVALKQITAFGWQKLPSLLSHLGLFVILTAGSLGSADRQQLKMFCEKDHPERRALDHRMRTKELPIGVELKRFTIEEYPAKLTLSDRRTYPWGAALATVDLEAGSHSAGGMKMGAWQIRIGQVLDNACPKQQSDSIGFVACSSEGATTAVWVEAVSSVRRVSGWIACGSYLYPAQSLALDSVQALTMPPREPKRFASEVRLVGSDGRQVEAVIEVNKPVVFDGWKIYQYGYDREKGRWSAYSVLELVADPWMPAVYVGILSLLAGAICLFFRVQQRKEASE